LGTWICGFSIFLFFLPQLNAYRNTVFDQNMQIEMPENIHSTSKEERQEPSSSESKQISQTVQTKKTLQKSTYKLPSTIPQRILLIGSSSMNSDLGAFLTQALRRQELDVHRHAKVGSGLARPDFYNWMEELPSLLNLHQPELVIVQFIGNDCQSLILPDGTLEARYDTPEWEEAYRNRIIDLITLLHRQQIRVSFLGMSNVISPGFRRNLKNSNRIIQETAAKHKSSFVSLWEQTSLPQGGVLQNININNIERPMFQEDGIHLSREGARIVAQETFKQLNTIYDWR
jgi:hypothetical protein